MTYNKICEDCGFKGVPSKKNNIDFLSAIIALFLVIVFWPLAILYVIYKVITRKDCCANCGSMNLIGEIRGPKVTSEMKG